MSFICLNYQEDVNDNVDNSEDMRHFHMQVTLPYPLRLCSLSQEQHASIASMNLGQAPPGMTCRVNKQTKK